MDKPLRPCKSIGCRALTTGSYCDNHKPESHYSNKPRKSSTERGYNSKWRIISKNYLSSHPWCVHCEARGVMEPATETDHIVPHKGNMMLFWDPKNWQGLCHACHSYKTATEDGGFGHTPHP